MSTSATDSNRGDDDDSQTESICVKYQIVPSVKATAISSDTSIYGTVSADCFVYYRYVISNPLKLITVSVRPLVEEKKPGERASTSPPGDPDLYISNKFDGLVVMGSQDTADAYKEFFTWKCTNTGSSRVDIHPEDIHRKAGDTLLIGVFGSKERNDYELLVLLIS